MEIQSLRLLLSEADINTLITQQLADQQPVRDLRVQLGADGVHLTGVYPTPFLNVRFETLWELSASQSKLVAHLKDIKVVGLPAAMLRGAILGVIEETASGEDALQIEGEAVLFDLERLLAKHGWEVRTNLKLVRCEAGHVCIEAGS